jgi:ABC-type dipeptide/oligopeptide/nickel transport system permease subunit
MDLSIVLLATSIALFIGYIIGKKEGLSSGYTKGIYEGADE